MYDKPMLGLNDAMAALQAMLAEANKEPQRPVAMAVVDDHGDMICFARMDRTAPNPVSLAYRKAYTAARARSDTPAFRERLASGGISVRDLGDPNLVPVQGGIVIARADGTVLGGIGVSGRTAQQDEEIAKIGLAAMKL